MYANRSYKFINIGCNANQADAERIASRLRANGSVEANEARDADTLVVMTCAFTHERQAESLLQIEKFAGSSTTRMIVSGCLPDINPSSLRRFPGVEIIRPRDLNRGSDSTEHDNVTCGDKNDFRRIRVSRGCLGRCTFCAIPKATGPLTSRSQTDVLSEIEGLLCLGHRRIMLSGEDVGAYGRDIGTSLGKLLTGILALDAELEIRIESINPHWLTLLLKETGTSLADSRVSPYWYVPIQAASNRLLKLMQRPYTVEEFRRSTDSLRSLIPGFHLVTDLIVGHPGEEVEDILAIVDLLKRTPINYLEVMRFDSHQGIKATTLPGAISEEEKSRRASYVILLFVHKLLSRDLKVSLRKIGLLPVNTNLKAPDFFKAMSTSLELEALPPTQNSIVEFLRNEITLRASTSRMEVKHFAAEICRRIGPPGPVNMPLGSS